MSKTKGKMFAFDNDLNLYELMEKLGEEKTRELLASLSEAESRLLYEDPYFLLRKNQIIKDDGRFGTMALSGRGFGKMTCNSTPILTKNGWKKHGELVVGDVLYDEKGNETKVTGFYPQPKLQAYRFYFSDNTHIDSGAEHLWYTFTHQERQFCFGTKSQASLDSIPDDWASLEVPTFLKNGEVKKLYSAKVRTTQEILDTFTHGARGDRNHCIPLTRPVKLVEKPLNIDPYWAGLWLGDGSTGSGTMTVHIQDKDHYIKAAADAGYQLGTDRAHTDVENKPNTWNLSFLRMKEVSETFKGKVIPYDYLYGSIEQRSALLAGLLDSDGYASVSTIEFCSMRKDHAEAVLWLARSLGQKPTLKLGRAMLNGKDYGTKYRVGWKPATKQDNPFRLKRKADKLVFSGSQQVRNQHRMITAWEDLGYKEGYSCISVDSPNSIYLVGEALIPTHNTFMGSVWCNIRAYQGYGPLLIVGQTASDCNDVMVDKNPSSIIQIAPEHFKPEYFPSKRLLVYPNGILGFVRSGDSVEQLRGINSQTVWVDELAKFDKLDECWSNILFGLRQGTNPQYLITTTPRPKKLIKELYNSDDCVVVTGSTFENAANLNERSLAEMKRAYEGTSLGDQELHGLIVWESEQALWKRSTLDDHRAAPPSNVLQYRIGLDPSVGTGKSRNDSAGIVVVCSAMINGEKCAFLLEDMTIKGSVDDWAKQVKKALDAYPKATIIAESNQGGELIIKCLQNVGIPSGKVKLKHHHRSKYIRAQPVALKAEQGCIFHVGKFTELEDELTSYSGEPGEKSPNRMDAYVLAINDLIIDNHAPLRIDRLGI